MSSGEGELDAAALRCPGCDAPLPWIAWGYPDDELMAAAERGEVILGGCVVNAPVMLRCPRCNRRLRVQLR